jgi:ribonuclease Z
MQRLELAGIEVEALSIGGIETCIHLPRMKVAFDIGRCPPEVVKVETVLFTHAHMDHMGGVAFHTSTRALRNMRPPTYVIPRPYEAEFERLFEVWRGLDRSEMPHETHAIGPGEEYELKGGLVARPFPAFHTAPCQGYALWSRREKLKPAYSGRAGPEIAELRRQGVEITDTHERPEVAFCTDTRIDALERVEVLRFARLLILETTFVDDRVSVEECRAKGHIHLDEIAARARLFRNEAILLTHFSARYKSEEIVEALDAKLPAHLRRRVTPLLGGHY